MTAPARTVFFGSGAFGVPSLRVLAASPLVDLVGVVTAPPRAAGRSGRPRATAIQDVAEELAVRRVLTPERLRDGASIEAVHELEAGLIVVADYGQIVPAALLDPSSGALNLHPSLLPRWRGASPIPATILAGDTTTGVTIIRMDAGMDTGPIVAHEAVPLAGDEVRPELEDRLAEIAGELLDRTLAPWLAGAIAPTPQDDAAATVTRQLRREDGRLDPGRAAADLERQVRAYQPWPGSYVETDAGRLLVWRATVAPTAAGDRQGAIVRHHDGLALATVDGRLVLEDVQPAGGRRMAGNAFSRGRGRALLESASRAPSV